MHDNEQAIRLYETLGFERVPVFALKNKNAYNEPLFTGQQPEEALNPYATISVDVREPDELMRAIEAARRVCETVILEEYCAGEDLRIVVIDFEVVAAAIRRPPRVIGTGQDDIAELIQTQSRRRRAATGGESSIPMDAETERCVRFGGYGMDDVSPEGESLIVRKTANLHTGATIHDVTAKLSPALAEAARKSARARRQGGRGAAAGRGQGRQDARRRVAGGLPSAVHHLRGSRLGRLRRLAPGRGRDADHRQRHHGPGTKLQ